MAKGFNLTAEINLRGPSNIRTVVADIKRQVGSVSVNVSPTVNRASVRAIANDIRRQIGNLSAEINVRVNAGSVRNLSRDIRQRLGTITSDVQVKADASSIRRSAANIRSQFKNISTNVTVNASTSSIRQASSAIRRQLGNINASVNINASAASIRQVASNIRRQLGSINATVNVGINAASLRGIGTYTANLRTLNGVLVQTATSASSAAASIASLTAAMGAASRVNLGNININLGNAGNAARTAANNVGLAGNEIENFGRQAGLAVRRFAAFSAVTSVIYGITNAIKNGISAFIDYDLQLTRISQVTGDTKVNLANITKTVNDLSTSFGVSSNELTTATVTLAQAGLTARDTERALKALALSALAPSFDDMNQTVEGSIALMRQFGITTSQLEGALGSINSVAAKFAVEASDIITAIQRTGGVFAASSRGVSEGTEALNEFIAVFTSIRATTRESAETIATGLRTIFTRIQRGDTIEALKEFGVTLTDLEGKFVGPYVAVQRLSEGLSRLDPRDLKFSQIVEELGGFRQIGKVLPLIQQFSTAQEALKIAQQGQGSLADDAAKGQMALAIQIAKVRQEFLALIRSVGNTDSFQNIVKVGLDLASALIKVADAAKGLIPLVGLFAALRGAQAITQFAGGFGRGFRGAPTQRASEGGPIRHFAAGGYVTGFGNGDTVSAKLTPGEFVMRKSAVQNIGVSNLHSLNRNSGGITPSSSVNRYSSDIQRFNQRNPTNQSGIVKSVKSKNKKKPPDNALESWKEYPGKTDLAHFGNSTPLTPAQFREYLNRKVRAKGSSISRDTPTRSSKLTPSLDVAQKQFKIPDISEASNKQLQSIIDEIGISQKSPILLSLPTLTNQALKSSGSGTISSKLAAWMISHPKVLLSGHLEKSSRRSLDRIKLSDLAYGITSQIFANTITKKIPKKPLVKDSDLKNIPNNFWPLLSADKQLYLENRADIVWKRIARGDRKGTQDRQESTQKLTGLSQNPRNIRRREERAYDKATELAISRRRNLGGSIQRFPIGGEVKPVSRTRTIGIIDSDDWKEDPIVAAQMKMMGIAKLDEYKVYMSNLVAERRKSGAIGRLRTVFGVAASGKTTAAYGGSRSQEADNARLRKTTRKAIRVPSDLEGLDEVIDTTSVLGPRNAASLIASDRIRNLSSRSKASQDAILVRRDDRDRRSESGIPDPSGRNYGLFKRKPGATKSAPVDTGIDEAWLAASEVSGVDPKRVITTDVATGKRIGAPNVRTPKKTAVFQGALRPTTAGHVEAIMQGAKKSKISPEDTVIYISGNTPIDPFNRDDQKERTAILPQTSSTGPSAVGMAQAVLGSKGFNISAAPKGIAPGVFPKAFKIEGQEDSYIVPKGDGNVAYMGDDKTDAAVSRNLSLGYKSIQIARDGISGTAARAAIMSNDVEAMKKLLTPEGIAYLKPYMATIQKRPKLLDAILKRIEENAQKGRGRAGRYSSTLAELSTLPARVTAKTPLDVAERVKYLREQRDRDEAILGRRAARMLPKIERLGRSSGGATQRFEEGGTATPAVKASTGDIIKLLGIERAAAVGGIRATDVYTALKTTKPTPQQAASKAAILAEFTKEKTSLAKKAEASETRKRNKATAKGLVFGAAGLFGSAFAAQPVTQTIQDNRLKDPTKQHTVSIYSGIYKNQKRASSIDASFDKAIGTIPMQQAQKEKRSEMTAQKKRVGMILGGFESGRELALDFDRTLAFGADKILADPKQPRFSEFSDTAKVTEALGKAKLSVLGRQLASLVAKKPELLKNIRVITARPKATLPLIQTWLTSKGLPIQAGQFKGFGGPNVSGSDIAKLKAAELTPGSIFVDDDKRNTSVARKRADEGIDVYRYRGVKKLKEDTQSLEDIESLKGSLLEAFIRRLGAVGSPKGRGFDFMTGLGRVSQKFEPKLPPNIPTDVKRTLAGPSTIKDNIVTYLKNVKGFNNGGAVQSFMAGGVAQAKNSGGLIQRFIDGGWVKRMQQQSPKDLNKELVLLDSTLDLFGFQRKVPVSTFSKSAPFMEDAGIREVKERISSIKEFLASKTPQKKEKTKKEIVLPKAPSGISDYLKSLIEENQIYDITGNYDGVVKQALNKAYKGNLGPGNKQQNMDKVGPKSIVSFAPNREYIDVSVGSLEKDIEYIDKVKKLKGKDSQRLAANKGYSISDMLDAVRAYQAIGLDSAINTALGKKDDLSQSLADTSGLNKTERKKLGPAVDKPLSSFVGSLDAAMQFSLPEKLYSGIGASKQKLFIESAGVKVNKLEDTKKLVGKTVSIPSFLSTSEVPATAESFARTGMMTIETNKKAKGLNPERAKTDTINRDKSKIRKTNQRLIADSLGKGRADENYADDYDIEVEYILPRNSKFKVKNIEANDNSEEGGNILESLNMDWAVKMLNRGGMVQKFMAGGAATKTRKPKEVFGTGETIFPPSISKAYAKDQQTAEENLRAKLAWDKYPKNERIMVDDDKVKQSFQQPFDKARFTASFKEKISRDTLFDRMSDFAKFVGLPQEDLTVALPLQLDFGASKRGGGLSGYGSAQFQRDATGVRPYEGYDLSKSGYGEKQKQEAYGLKKLIETKEKEIKKITKTPTETFDDGSFSFDSNAYQKANGELDSLKKRSFELSKVKSAAEKSVLSEQQAISATTGRGTLSFASSMGYSSDTKNDVLYHEMTHQLFQGLRTKSADSFNRYRSRVSSLFSGDNNDLADAFDALTANGGYSSADVVYGRSYKSRSMDQMLSNYYRTLGDSSRDATPVSVDMTKDLSALNMQARTTRRAREYRPINPKINQALLQGGPKFGTTQEVIDRMEDSGKEEFLTTLIENLPRLDDRLQSILDSTLTELLGGAGIKRRKYAVGGMAQFAGGGHSSDTVPALVSNGEAYVPPETARAIGYGKLAQMNKADRNGMSRFASGGISVIKGPGTGTSDSIPANLPVGSFIIREKATKALGLRNGGSVGGPVSTQEFATGGAVQRLFIGGLLNPPPAARPNLGGMNDAEAQRVVGVVNTVNEQLGQLATVLQDLGVTSGDTARLMQRGTQATYAQAIQATEADIRRARIAGASAQQIAAAESMLRNIRQQADRDIRARRASVDTPGGARASLGSLGGQDLQKIDFRADILRQQMTETERNRLASQTRTRRGATVRRYSDEQVEERLQRRAGRINRQSYEQATTQVTGGRVNLGAVGLTGDDAQRYIQQSMKDRNTLAQMDMTYIPQRAAQIRQQLAAERGVSGDRNAMRRLSAQALRMAEQEARDRANTARATAMAAGAAGPGGGAGSGVTRGIGMAFGLQMAGSLIAQQINPETSSSNAQLSAGLQGGTNMLATGTMIGSNIMEMFPSMTRLLGPISLLTTAALAAGQAFMDARNASIEFEKKLATNKAAESLEKVSKGLEKLGTDLKNIKLQEEITKNLLDATHQVKNSLSIDRNTAKAFWVNMFDAFFFENKGNQGAAARSKILEKEGTIAYMRTTSYGQMLGGNFTNPSEAAAQATQSSTQRLIPAEAQANSKAFADTANATMQLLESKVKSGTDINELVSENSAEWKLHREAIARSNAATEQEILTIENMIGIEEKERESRKASVMQAYAESEVRKKIAATQNALAQKDLENTTNTFSRSFTRMFANMEQAIGKASFSLSQMTNDIDLLSSALTGQAQTGKSQIATANILQNQRAYSEPEVEKARGDAASLFGADAKVMKGLLGVGETIESTVMSTLNKNLRERPGINNEVLATKVDREVKSALEGLSLPPDLSDQLSKEVSKALEGLRTEGDNKIDFADLNNKLGSLSKVVDTAKQAQDIAVKALENYQNALNMYSDNINKITDLQVSRNSRLIKSQDIQLSATLNLNKALGQTNNSTNAKTIRDAKVSALTGGSTNITDIENNIFSLNTRRESLEVASNAAGARGATGAEDVIKFKTEMVSTNTALRQNIEALKMLAESTDVAAEAMDKIEQAQQKQSGRVSFIEKLVTSTPEELNSLNGAFARLNNNMRGQINDIRDSQSAQKAYREAIDQGASGFEAMKAAQAAFANDRKETLGALQDILPFLGNSQQGNSIKADVLQSMLQESGVGVSPIFQQVLNTLRNPQADPATQSAIQEYKQANNLQSLANQSLARMDETLSNQLANKSAKALVDALKGTVLSFDSAQLKDLNNHVSEINAKIPKNPNPPVGKASGGVIYAAAGMGIDFAPQGTDTVPAMLTPGEFVVNRAATQANLPLLNAINSKKYSGGGSVRYYASGGYVSNLTKNEFKDTENLESTKEKYLDPKFVKNDLNTALIKYVYKGPRTTIRSQAGAPEADFYDSGKSSIKANSDSAIMAGSAPNIVMVSNGYAYDNSNPRFDVNEMGQLGAVLSNATNSNTFNEDHVSRKDYNKFYREKLIEFNNNTLRANLWNTEGSFNGNPPSAVGGDPYKPTSQTSEPIGLILSTNKEFKPSAFSSDDDTKDILKIYGILSNASIGVGALAGLSAAAISIGTLGAGIPLGLAIAAAGTAGGAGLGGSLGRSYSIVSTNASSKGIAIKSGGGDTFVPPESYSANGAEWIQKNASSLKEKYNENRITFQKSLDFAIDPTKATFEKGSENLSVARTAEKLSNIYNDRSSMEIFGANDSSLDFDGLGASENISTLYLLKKKYNQDIINKLNSIRDIDTFRNASQFKKIQLAFSGRAKQEPAWAGNIPMDIGILDDTNSMKQQKEFPWIGDTDPSLFLTSIKAEIDKDRKETLTGKKFGFSQELVGPKSATYTIKLPTPIGGVNIPYEMSYLKYRGPRYNGSGKQDDLGFNIDAVGNREFLPDSNKFVYLIQSGGTSKNPFKNLDNNTHSYFKGNAELLETDIFNPLNLVNDPNIQNLITSINNPNAPLNQDDIIAKIRNTTASIDLESYLKSSNRPDGVNDNINVFANNNPIGKVDIPIGDFLSDIIPQLLEARKNKAKESGQTVVNAQSRSTPLTNLVQNFPKITRGALSLFGRRKIPGFANGWLFNDIRGLPGVGGRPVRNDLDATEASRYIAGVFNEAATDVSQLSNMANSPQQYQNMKESYLLLSGAYSAFDGIASGNTRFLQSVTNGAEGNFETAFRSLGMGMAFQQAASRQLSEDFKSQIAGQLKGTKIASIGADGSIQYQDFKDQVPKDYNDLVSLGLNPYNEFANTNTRTTLINKLGYDISIGRDSSGMSYYDPRTLAFITSNLKILRSWYGGENKWPGQDSFFDQGSDPKTRTIKLITSLSTPEGVDLRNKASVANRDLGLSSTYGDIPDINYFTEKMMANATIPTFKANGGMIYASEGQFVNFQPRGTDTVPAMLTPGEFVVNAKSTAQNLPLLRSINNGGVKGLSKGGVAYLSEGGISHRSMNPLTGDRTLEKGDDLGKKYRINSGIYDYLTLETKMPDWLTSLNNLSFDANSMRFFSDASFYKALTQIREATDLRSLQDLSYDFVKGFKYRDYNKDNRLSGFDFTTHLSKTDGILGLIDPDVGGDFQPKDLVKWRTTKAKLKAKSSAARVVKNLTPDLENLRDILSDQKPAGENNNPEFKNRNHYESPAALLNIVVSQWKKERQQEKNRLKSQQVLEQYIQQSQTPMRPYLDRNFDDINVASVVKDILTKQKTPDTENLVSWLENTELAKSTAEKIQELLPARKASDLTGQESSRLELLGIELPPGDKVADASTLIDTVKNLIKNGPEAFMIGMEGETKRSKGKSLIYSLLAQSARIQGINNLIKARALFSGSDASVRKTAYGDMARVDSNTVYKDQTRTPENFRGREDNVARPGQFKLGIMHDRLIEPVKDAAIPGSGPNGKETSAERTERKNRARMANGRGRSAIRDLDLWDDNKDGKISFTEYNRRFLGSRDPKAKSFKVETAERKILFDKIDVNKKNGFIDPAEFPNMVGKPLRYADIDTEREGKELGDTLGTQRDRRGSQKLAYDKIDKAIISSVKSLFKEDFQKLYPDSFTKASEYLEENIASPRIKKLEGISEPTQKRQILADLASDQNNRDWGLFVKAEEELDYLRIKIKQDPYLFPRLVNKAYTKDLTRPQDILHNANINYDNTLDKSGWATINKADVFETIWQDYKLSSSNYSNLDSLEKTYRLKNELNSKEMAEDQQRSEEAEKLITKARDRRKYKKDLTKKTLRGLSVPESYFEDRVYTKLWRGKYKDYYDVPDPTLAGHIDMYNTLIPFGEDGRLSKPTEEQENDFYKKVNNGSTRKKVIYASNGMLIPYQPRGTDTVPAMLTPGEFVVNARATARNLPLLHSINEGSAPGYSNGGIVYLADGAQVGVPSPQKSAKTSSDFRTEQEKIRYTRETAYRLSKVDKTSQNTENLSEGIAGGNREILSVARSVLSSMTTNTKNKNSNSSSRINPNLKNNTIPDLDNDNRFNKIDSDNNILLQTLNSMKDLLYSQKLDALGNTKKIIAVIYDLFNGSNFRGALGKNQVKNLNNEATNAANLFNSGGIVYASNGQLMPYSPRGTDTVPAMLTPGEFVVNRSATRANLPLLQTINSSNGGLINYLSDGGMSTLDASIQKDFRDSMTDAKAARFAAMSEEKFTDIFKRGLTKRDNALRHEANLNAMVERIREGRKSGIGDAPQKSALAQQMMFLRDGRRRPVPSEKMLKKWSYIDALAGRKRQDGGHISVPPVRASENEIAAFLNSLGRRNVKPIQGPAMPPPVRRENNAVSEVLTDLAIERGKSSPRRMYEYLSLAKPFLGDSPTPLETGLSNKDYVNSPAFQEALGRRDTMVNIENRFEREDAKKTLGHKLLKYTSGDKGRAALNKILTGARYKNATMRVGDTGMTPVGDGDLGRTERTTGNIVFNKPLISRGLVDHELGHTIQGALPPDKQSQLTGGGDGKIATLPSAVRSFVLKMAKDPEYQAINTYPGHSLMGKKKDEIFPVMLQVMDKPLFNKHGGESALRAMMKVMGFNKGGVVYAADGGMPGPLTKLDTRRKEKLEEEYTKKIKDEEIKALGFLGLPPDPTPEQMEEVLGRNSEKAKKLIEQAIVKANGKPYTHRINKEYNIKLPRFPRLTEELRKRSWPLVKEQEKPNPFEIPVKEDPLNPTKPFDANEPRVYYKGKPIVTKANGGVIYASTGTLVNYQPRGTDTVPAMLTPGEFVVNAKATEQHLPLLHAINNGQKYMSKGGILYAQEGAVVGAGLPNDEKEMNRKKRERMALAGIDPKNRTEEQQGRLEKLRTETGWYSDDNVARREKNTRIALAGIDPKKRTDEQEKKLKNLRGSDPTWDEANNKNVERKQRLQEERMKDEKSRTNLDNKYINDFLLSGAENAEEWFTNNLPGIKQPRLEGLIQKIEEMKAQGVKEGIKDKVKLGNLENKYIRDYLESGSDDAESWFGENYPGLRGARAEAVIEGAMQQQKQNNGNASDDLVGVKVPVKEREISGENEATVPAEVPAVQGKSSDADKQTMEQNKAEKDKKAKDRQAELQYYKNNSSPFMSLYTKLSKEVEENPERFELFNPNAIRDELKVEDIVKERRSKWEDLAGDAKASKAKALFDTDLETFKVLNNMTANAQEGLDILDQYPAGKGRQIKNRPILFILQKQLQAGSIAAQNLDQAWNILRVNDQLQFKSQAAPSNTNVVDAVPDSAGGIIYANNGMMIPYSPRGTDTVPAMLTPGEFVVNRSATQANLPLLRAINNNRYANGGQVGAVNYLYTGGQATSEAGGGGGVSNNNRSESTSLNFDGLSKFTTKFEAFIGQLQSINPIINMQGTHTVVVEFGASASVFKGMEEGLQRYVVSQVNAALNNVNNTLNNSIEGSIDRVQYIA